MRRNTLIRFHPAEPQRPLPCNVIRLPRRFTIVTDTPAVTGGRVLLFTGRAGVSLDDGPRAA